MTFGVRHVLASLLAAAVLCGIWVMQPWLSRADHEWLRKARNLETADVGADVKAATRSGDVRFVAVYGVGLMVPGVPDAEWADGNLQIIRGTSDALESGSHRRFVDAANEYALRYNALMLQHRQNTAQETAPNQTPR